MKIIIYGMGCDKCNKTHQAVQRAVEEVGVSAEIERVGDVRQIVMAGVIATPAVSVDGAVKVSGRVPTLDEVKGWISG